MSPVLTELPPELLEAIFLHLDPSSVVAISQTSKGFRGATAESPVIWRHFCRTHFAWWAAHHNINAKFAGPISDVDWRDLFMSRMSLEQETLRVLQDVLATQQGRLANMDKIAAFGYDVKETLLKEFRCEDSAEDVLARRFYANAILERIQRELAIDLWKGLSEGSTVPMEQALGAYDMFTRVGDDVDLDYFTHVLDKLKENLLVKHPNFEEMNTRTKASTLATFLRAQGFQGVSAADYGSLMNSFIGFALTSRTHETLPLISAAIYCALGQRLGLDARPCGFLYHVYCIVYAPPDHSLEGDYKPSIPRDSELIYLDPFRSAAEVPINDLRRILREAGILSHQHNSFLGPVGANAMVLRSARNIVNSVQAIRQAAVGAHGMQTVRLNTALDTDNAFYGALWAMLILAPGLNDPDTDPPSQASHRRQYLPYLLEHVNTHHPWDLTLLEQYVVPFFAGQPDGQRLTAYVRSQYAKDKFAKPVHWRSAAAKDVRYKVGTLFTHRRYHYEGVVTGWDTSCEMEEEWIETQGVDRLPNGREQCFYHVMSCDKTTRYVAEENVKPVDPGVGPSEAMLKIAGRYFKRWDLVDMRFVSNVRDEYPDD